MKETRAEERIKEMQAKSSARIELSEGGLQQKMLKLDSVVASEQADAALEAMKAEMGMLPQTAGEDPLAKLKAKVAEEKAPEQTVNRNIEV